MFTGFLQPVLQHMHMADLWVVIGVVAFVAAMFGLIWALERA